MSVKDKIQNVQNLRNKLIDVSQLPKLSDVFLKSKKALE